MVSPLKLPSVKEKINWQSRKIGILFKKKNHESKSRMSAYKWKKGMRKRKCGDGSLDVVYTKLSFPTRTSQWAEWIRLVWQHWASSLSGCLSGDWRVTCLRPLSPLHLPLKGVNAVITTDFSTCWCPLSCISWLHPYNAAAVVFQASMSVWRRCCGGVSGGTARQAGDREQTRSHLRRSRCC